VTADGLVFDAHTHSTSECGIEKKYNLFIHNHLMYFAGIHGKLMIHLRNEHWSVFKINFQSNEQEGVGFIKNKIYDRALALTEINGIHLMSCQISGKNETALELFKLTNVSKH